MTELSDYKRIVEKPHLAALAKQIADLQARLERYKVALQRLGSSETMTLPFALGNNAASLELMARVDFARKALSDSTEGLGDGK